MSSTEAGRKPKWHPTPPPPPSPVILRLPRHHHRRKKHETAENSRRERVVEERERVDENWRFQVDVLKAECSLLRRERENAVLEMEKNKLNFDRTLRSAIHIIGKKKTYEEYKGNGANKGEMEDLEDKLEELLRGNVISSDSETKKRNNFSKKAFILQKKLEKLGGESKDERAKEIRVKGKTEDLSSVLDQNNSNKFFDVEVLRRKMEGISKGVYERMEEEYGAMLISTTHTPSASASTSKRFEFPDDSLSLSTRPPHQEQGVKKCSGNCKMIVRRIMEQVREESKQWCEMQEMLGKVKKEMDQLKFSRNVWQQRALVSEHQIQSMHSTAQEWKRKALTIRSKAKQLKKEVYALRGELNNYGEEKKVEKTKIKDGQKIISLGAQIAKEKREFVYHMKEKENYRSASREFERETSNNDGRRKSQIFDHGLVGLNRLPFQDIGNSASPKARQNGKIIHPL